jgi:multidrug efflux system membrane fusion protein
MKQLYVFTILLSFIACTQKPTEPGKAGGKGAPAFPVDVAQVKKELVQYSVNTVGTIDAYEVVNITARVAGVVQKVSFREGDTVKEGQTLITIDADRYALAVAAAAASKDKAKVSLDDAEVGLERREGMASKALIPTEELDTWRTKVRAAKVDVESANVSLSQASLNLSDSRVKAPFTGTIESRSISQGQYVQPGTLLATMIQREPLLLRFKVTDSEATRLTIGMEAQFTVQGDQTPRKATIRAIAGMAHPATRLVDIVAEVSYESAQTLRPGSFAEVKISTGAQEAPVIPETAVRPSGKGFLAFTVVDGVATERVLQLGMRTDDGRIEVLSGITEGETLVIRGAEALRNGAKVKPKGAQDKSKKGASQPTTTKGGAN